RDRDYLYIRTLHPGCIKTPPEQLYKVSEDPHLQHDLIDEQPPVVATLKAHLADWWHRYAGFAGAGVDPMQAALATGPCLYSQPAAYARHLQASGRTADARHLRQRLGLAD